MNQKPANHERSTNLFVDCFTILHTPLPCDHYHITLGWYLTDVNNAFVWPCGE